MRGYTNFSTVRHDVLPFIERNPAQRILELGCGSGNTLAYLKENGYASYVAGVEQKRTNYDPSNTPIDKLLITDVETLDFSFKEKFDAILFLDVLEHLYEPFELMKKAQGLLSPSGYMVVSIPNIRNYGVLKKLILKGRWDYKEKGVLDRTHIRFFTKKSFLDSMEAEGIKMELCGYKANVENDAGLVRYVPLLKGFFILQHIFKFRPGRR